MLKYISSVILIAVILACSDKNSGTNNDTRFKITYKSPLQIVENKGVSFISEFYISYYGRYTIYELPYHVTSEVDNVLMYDSVKYEYFICDKNRNGYLIKHINDSFSKRINGDSIISTRAMDGGKGDKDLFAELTIRSITQIKNTSEALFKYTFDNYFYDSAYLYYKKELQTIPFSFSKALDSSYSSKLSKIQLFIKHKEQLLPPNLQDFYINSFEIENVPSKDEPALKKLLERFINAERNNR